MNREEIIRRLAEAFGEHRTYDPATRSYVPDGNDGANSTLIQYIASDGDPAMRALTYGEIADALAAQP